jgi:hypothetical protein
MANSIPAKLRSLFAEYAAWTKSAASPGGETVNASEIKGALAILKRAGRLDEAGIRLVTKAYGTAELSPGARKIYDAIVSPIGACTAVGPTDPVYACTAVGPTDPVSACTAVGPTDPVSACTAVGPADPVFACIAPGPARGKP